MLGTLLKYILELILIFWLLRALLRLAAPFIFRSVAQKMTSQAENFYRQQQQQQRQYYSQRQPEGEMHVDSAPQQNTKRKANLDNAGEFIDYEEVK
ncbi:DUF4834 domain-containing protein [Solitalea longa]|uniref:DUF4834 domain-containing protein n=1 Tax=Solitalea longa TaxID=2079460 RepID=A0A2S5AA39_9SPHI|nr:DUF4834 family protein [Solitalea longa]POY39107.1 DUF4834 domain-containing protein [Solitalea longa]